MKQLLTAGKNSTTQRYFIMGNKGQLEGTPYFDTLKECMVAIFRYGKGYTNIYDMSDKDYAELANGTKV